MNRRTWFAVTTGLIIGSRRERIYNYSESDHLKRWKKFQRLRKEMTDAGFERSMTSDPAGRVLVPNKLEMHIYMAKELG